MTSYSDAHYGRPLVLQWDGTSWAVVSAPTSGLVESNDALSYVTCVSASDCWAVGYFISGSAAEGGVIIQTLTQHWDGVSWVIVTSPNTSPTEYNWPSSVTCVSASDCWVVGSADGGSTRQTLALRWDGASWTIVASANTASPTSSYLLSAACVLASDCWAVGYSFNGANYQTLAEHWDGTSWAIVVSANPSTIQNNVLNSVTCLSSSDCWAVGYAVSHTDAGGYSYGVLIERWDGTSWEIVTAPNPIGKGPNIFHAVTCVSPSDCWAVGYTLAGNNYQTLVERWDGASWTIATSANTLAVENNILYAVTCVSASDCWAVGYYVPTGGVYQTLTERWDGSSWTVIASPNTRTADNDVLLGVMCVSASDCWAVGYYHNGANYQTLAQRWDGASWAIIASPNTSPTQDNVLSGVACVSRSDCWAVGQSYDGSTVLTVTQRWDGASWGLVNSPNRLGAGRSILYGVACVSVSDCWAVGYATGGAYHTLTEHYSAVNQAPVVAAIPDQNGWENSQITFLVSASDPDGDLVAIAATGLPAGATLTDHGDNTATFSWTPDYSAANTYSFTVTATDPSDRSDSKTATVHVANTNRAPSLTVLPDRSGREGDAVDLVLSATDPDGDAVTYSGEGLPTGAVLNSVTGAFAWTPNFQQAGTHMLRFVASDGSLTDPRTMMIVVANVQRAPVLTPIGNKAAFEGAATSVSVSATDPEGDAITLLTSTLPEAASFVDHGDGTGVFSWTPGAHARGDYSVTFRATDGIAEAVEAVTIRVAPTNGVPTFTPIGNRTVSEADQINFVVNAIDSNGDVLTYSATNVPRGASFDAPRRVFSWIPDHAQAGSYVVTFRVTDGTTSVTENATITVTNVNRAPVVSGVTSAIIKANRTLSMSVPLVDPDGDALTYAVTGLPDGAEFDAVTGAITWRPTTTQIGDHSVGADATDGVLSAHVTLKISVMENQAPLVSVSAPATVEVLQASTFMANASDPDGAALPTIAWDFDATDGFQAQRTGPNVTWAFPATGTFTVTARATDADGMETTQTSSVSVDDNVVLVIEALPDLEGGSGTMPARATVTNWDGTGIANATVTVNVYYEPIPGAGKVLLRTLTVTTGEDGSVLFDIPQDTPLMNLKGTHMLEASATTETSLGGDQETAQDTETYTL
ncbi:MAG: putative Ig domain-containing protein [Candidatus Thermoplasmatota archaeon]